MDIFIEKIKKQMLADKEKFISQKKIENLYVLELADKWVDMNVKDKEDYIRKLNAMEKIVNNNDFRNVIEIGRLALEEKNTNDKANEAARLITNIIRTEEYKENSNISGYKILSKFENSAVFKTDAFMVHSNIMIKLFEYLKSKEEI